MLKEPKSTQFSQRSLIKKTWTGTLERLCGELADKSDDVKKRAAKDLSKFVSTQVRELKSEIFSIFMGDLNGFISSLVSSSNPSDQMGGITAINELLEVDFRSHTISLARLSDHLRVGLNSTDTQVLSLAAQALGRLSRLPITLTTEMCVSEMKIALGGLKERNETRRHGAVLVLRAIAFEAPTTFFGLIHNFIDVVWVPLRDHKLIIRQLAADALGVALRLICERDNAFQWNRYIYEETVVGFKAGANENVVHGSLLSLGELLTNSGDFMSGRTDEVCGILQRYMNEKEKPLVKQTVISLLPKVAASNQETFVKKFLSPFMEYLFLNLSKGNDSERSTALLAIGEIAKTLSSISTFKQYLPTIMNEIQDTLTNKHKTTNITDALSLLTMLAQSLGPAIHLGTEMRELLNRIFSVRLSPQLIAALNSLVEGIPSLLKDIQVRLIEKLSAILSQKFVPTTGKLIKEKSKANVLKEKIVTKSEEDRPPELIALALKTLGSFNLIGHIENIDTFLKEIAMNFLEEGNTAIRKEAAVAVPQLLVSICNNPIPRKSVSSHTLSSTLSEVIEKLLIVGIADPDPIIRKTVLKHLDPSLDHLLADPETLRSLFISLNDEELSIREISIAIIGRLSLRNPADVMPSLRRTLIQLLTEFEFSGDTRIKEESAQLLSILIRNSRHLIEPYTRPIIKALLPKLDQSQDPRVRQEVLQALGELAPVGSEMIAEHLDVLIPVIITYLEDQSSAGRRELALRVLGQLAHYTSHFANHFVMLPKLLNILLEIYNTEKSRELRRLTIKVIGALGAIDPYTHKSITENSRQEPSEDEDYKTVSQIVDPKSDDYFPCIAIQGLTNILKDDSLGAYHAKVIKSLVMISKQCLGEFKTEQFLPIFMPPLLHVMRRAEPSFWAFLFKELSVIVNITKGKEIMRKYLTEVFKIVSDFWHTDMLQTILIFIEDISSSMGDEFKVFLPILIPKLLSVLNSNNQELCVRVLRNLELIGSNLDDYLHLITPAVIALVNQSDSDGIKTASLMTIGRLCRILNFSEFASRIIHPMARLIQLSTTSIELKNNIFNTLCHLIYQLGSDYAMFVPMMNRILTKNQIVHSSYEMLVSKILKNQPLLESDLPNLGSITLGSGEDEDENGSHSEPNFELKVNESNLKKAWAASQQYTKEDWAEWMRRFSVELVRESPQRAIKYCLDLAQEYYPLVRDLFIAAFVSCWNALSKQSKIEFADNLRMALKSSHIPHEILQMWLNVAEFLEQARMPLPIEIKELGRLASKCHAYAKALHYKELEFESTQTPEIVESLMSLNNQLQQPEAAEGILVYSQKHLSLDLKETWYEKLHRWEDALKVYRNGDNDASRIGEMRCLYALGEWDRLLFISNKMWNEPPMRDSMAHLGAAAAWNLRDWSSMEKFVVELKDSAIEGKIMRTLLALQKARTPAEFDDVRGSIAKARDIVDTELTALLAESYQRAYDMLLYVQILSELEEIMDYKLFPERRQTIRDVWKQRLKKCERSVQTWQLILSVRALVHIEEESWIKFASLCRKSGALRQSHKILTMLLNTDPSKQPIAPLPTNRPKVTYQYILQLWTAGAKEVAYQHLLKFEKSLSGQSQPDRSMQAKCLMTLGLWQWNIYEQDLSPSNVSQILDNMKRALEYNPDNYKAWHVWASTNFEISSILEKDSKGKHSKNGTSPLISDSTQYKHIEASIRGFFKSISLSQPQGQSLQDTLRLLTLWFKYGGDKRIETELQEGFNSVPIDTWIPVIPQIIARMDSPNRPVSRMVLELLSRIGKEHPQALVYPLVLTAKSQVETRQSMARAMMNQMKQSDKSNVTGNAYSRKNLLDQVLTISDELIRVAITAFEGWHECLEDASRLYFTENNPDMMIHVLKPLHESLQSPPETDIEAAFRQTYSGLLSEAWGWCIRYQETKSVMCLNQAWDIYYNIHKSISKHLEKMKTLDLSEVSPKLCNMKTLCLAVPGTYQVGTSHVQIAAFHPILNVINSKQRPRKLRILGSDGKTYSFLLKGHEDLRQDERVMQLFGLINNLLLNNTQTANKHLRIQNFSVIPLSPNTGLLGWVPHCDTLNQLIKEYRASCEPKIPFNLEFKLLNVISGEYYQLTVIQKTEVFKYTLSRTEGKDLAKIMWLKSPSSEVWLERRTNYTRSLAVMSMAGYILGLGDRHPSNIMIDRYTGHVVHIDFGDCFDVAMHREKHPEKIPFRLTRMLINAMDASGIEGTFRTTCEQVLAVLRENRDSLMAVLEAFVHDPLINWRLLQNTTDSRVKDHPGPTTAALVDAEDRREIESPEELEHDLYSAKGKGSKTVTGGEEGAQNESEHELNERALVVIGRVHNKLTGRDFDDASTLNQPPLNVKEQVNKLILQATSHENLCQCFQGWCPFW